MKKIILFMLCCIFIVGSAQSQDLKNKRGPNGEIPEYREILWKNERVKLVVFREWMASGAKSWIWSENRNLSANLRQARDNFYANDRQLTDQDILNGISVYYTDQDYISEFFPWDKNLNGFSKDPFILPAGSAYLMEKDDPNKYFIMCINGMMYMIPLPAPPALNCFDGNVHEIERNGVIYHAAYNKCSNRYVNLRKKNERGPCREFTYKEGEIEYICELDPRAKNLSEGINFIDSIGVNTETGCVVEYYSSYAITPATVIPEIRYIGDSIDIDGKMTEITEDITIEDPVTCSKTMYKAIERQVNPSLSKEDDPCYLCMTYLKEEIGGLTVSYMPGLLKLNAVENSLGETVLPLFLFENQEGMTSGLHSMVRVEYNKPILEKGCFSLNAGISASLVKTKEERVINPLNCANCGNVYSGTLWRMLVTPKVSTTFVGLCKYNIFLTGGVGYTIDRTQGKQSIMQEVTNEEIFVNVPSKTDHYPSAFIEANWYVKIPKTRINGVVGIVYERYFSGYNSFYFGPKIGINMFRQSKHVQKQEESIKSSSNPF